MCALQMQAEYGPTLASNASEFDAALEKFLMKQVRLDTYGHRSLCHTRNGCGKRSRGQTDQAATFGGYLPATGLPALTLALPCLLQILMSRPRDEWKHDVMARYKALSQFSKEDARVQYLRIIRSLPYGEAVAACNSAALWHRESRERQCSWQ